MPSTTISASTKALSLPELLDIIFSYIHASPRWTPSSSGEDMVHTGSNLYCCAQVNRVWFAEAIRYLWRDMASVADAKLDTTKPGKRGDLLNVFARIDAPRRGMYARYVEKAWVNTVDEKFGDHCYALAAMGFPRLRAVVLCVTDEDGLDVPKIGKHAVEVVEVVIMRVSATLKFRNNVMMAQMRLFRQISVRLFPLRLRLPLPLPLPRHCASLPQGL